MICSASVLLPSAFAMYMPYCPEPPTSFYVKAIFAPLGDQAGSCSSPEYSVSSTGSSVLFVSRNKGTAEAVSPVFGSSLEE